MGALPRILVLIGSGELAAQMTRGHRMVANMLAGNGGPPARVRAAILDTPYGFQSNADALSATLLDYFGRRIGMSAAIASIRRSDDDVLARESAYATIRAAEFVFSGPGSPSYAIRQWAGSEIPRLLAEKLATGGALVFASAAALTLGRLTVPVYEIYKAGEDPYWLPGLDVLSTIGISVAVIPHWDNAEGPGHDTRFCFLGERRLATLEEAMPDDAFILGIDEHTAVLFDLDHDVALVHGKGGVTVRRRGRSVVHPAGESIPLAELRNGTTGADLPATKPATSPRSGVPDAAELALELLALKAQAAASSELARLVEPLVEKLVELRSASRSAGDFVTADDIRDRLVALGIELTDFPDGTTTFRIG
jgi:hypothetical protein